MKKIFVLFLAIFAMAYFSMPAFAGAAASVYQGSSVTSNCIDLSSTSTSASDCSDTSNNALVGLSAHVRASYYSDTGTNYAAETYNDKGKGQIYGLANLTSNVYVTSGDFSNLGSDNATTFNNWDVLGQQ